MPKSFPKYMLNKVIPRAMNSISETLSSAADGVSNVAASVTKSVVDGASNLVEWVDEVAASSSNNMGSKP